MSLPPSPVAPAADLAAGESPARVSLDQYQRDKLSLIGQMASSIAHELSNPLATIVASSQALLGVWPRTTPSVAPPELAGSALPVVQLREDLELILAEARRAGEIVHGLLASARLHPPEWRVCLLPDVIRRTVGLCNHHLKLHNISLQSPWYEGRDRYPLWSRIRGDANQLQQVLLNLIINAQQAITSHRGYGTVRITLGQDGPSRVWLAVEDDGPGVPPATREAIFQAFYTTKPPGQGTGLGLFISAEILRAHRGEITVETAASGGASFRLVLPSLAATERYQSSLGADVAASDPESIPRQTTGPSQAARRVLLVDDEAGIRRSVGKYLTISGFQVTECSSAELALELIRNGTFDLVLTDLRMPGLSGEEFFAVLEREYPNLAARVVFTSGDLLRESTRTFLKTSGRPSLQKPFELPELIQILDTVCPPERDAQRASA